MDLETPWEQLQWFRRGWKDGAIGELMMQDCPPPDSPVNAIAHKCYRMGHAKGCEDRTKAASEAYLQFGGESN